MNCPECYKHRDYKLCKVCNLCTNCCDCEKVPTESATLVAIQPRHLRLMQVYLSEYHDLLCNQAKEGDKVKEINDLAFLDSLISTVLELQWHRSRVTLRNITKYAEHLEAELTKRPVVYNKITGGKKRISPGGWPTLYTQREVDGYLGQSTFECYTGEESINENA